MRFENIKLMLRLARIYFLVPGFMLYIFGYTLATLTTLSFDAAKFTLGYAILGLAHLSVSFSNDYFDWESDRNSVKTPFSGGSKVLVKHPELKNLALRLAVLLIILSTVAAAIFVFLYSYIYWFFVFALFGGFLGWFYTAPPVRLAYRGLGEISTVLAVALFMPGMGYFAASGSIGLPFILFMFPLGCYGLFFILTVELPDVESDSLTQKTNMLTKWGRPFGTRASFVATIAGTVSLALVHASDALGNRVDTGLITMLSAIPLAGATISLSADLEVREQLVRQVKINMVAMIAFLLLLNASLFMQLLR